MSRPHPIPLALLVVALVFLFQGTGSLMSAILKIKEGNPALNGYVLGIPIFFGLLRRSNGWRIFAFVTLWLGMLASLVAFAVCTFLQGFTELVSFELVGFHLADVRPGWMAAGSFLNFLLLLWQHDVLNRPEIRSLFLQTRKAVDTSSVQA